MSAQDCLFCKMTKGEIPAEVVHDDGEVFAFKDIHPAAPTHLLVIPYKHVETLLEFERDDEALIGRMVTVATKLAREAGIGESGYRLVANCNRDGGQSVYHVHFHVLGGRRFGWPPD